MNKDSDGLRRGHSALCLEIIFKALQDRNLGDSWHYIDGMAYIV